MKISFFSNFFNWSIIILFIASLIPLLILSFYTEPILDDYVYALKLRHKSFLEVQINDYMSWGSRYTSTGLLITDPIYFGWFDGYRIISFLMIFLFVVGSYFMFYQITLNKKFTLILLSTFCFTYFFMLPEITSAFYWLAGSATYHLGNILSLFFIGIILKLYRNHSLIYKILSFLLIFLIIGCNEISMIYLDIFIFLLLSCSYYNNKKINTFYLSLLIFAGILTMYILVSPGNKFRSSTTAQYHLSLVNCIISMLWKTTVIIIRYFIIVFSIHLLVLYNLRNWLKNIDLPFLKFSNIFYIITFLIFMFLGSFPSLWSVGFFPPLRTVNVIFFAMNILSMLIAYKIVTLPFFNTNKFSPYTLLAILLLIVFSYTFTIRDKNIYNFSNNLYNSYKDVLTGNMIKYKEEMKERYETIRNSKKDTVYVKPIKNIPKTILRSDLKETNNHFYNQNMAIFFGKKAIILRKTNADN